MNDVRGTWLRACECAPKLLDIFWNGLGLLHPHPFRHRGEKRRPIFQGVSAAIFRQLFRFWSIYLKKNISQPLYDRYKIIPSREFERALKIDIWNIQKWHITDACPYYSVISFKMKAMVFLRPPNGIVSRITRESLRSWGQWHSIFYFNPTIILPPKSLALSIYGRGGTILAICQVWYIFMFHSRYYLYHTLFLLRWSLF